LIAERVGQVAYVKFVAHDRTPERKKETRWSPDQNHTKTRDANALALVPVHAESAAIIEDIHKAAAGFFG
jgi:hypothetical protein